MNQRTFVMRLATVAKKLGRAVRNVWLLAGITLFLFIGMELAYRVQRQIRAARWARSGTGAPHPHANEPWYGQSGGPREGGTVGFDPYRVYWGRWRRSQYLNVDSLGRRTTPQSPRGERGRQLFLLGGSVMWGWAHIDSLTIGAFLARRLNEANLADVEIQNYAQSGYTLTQELITLMLEIRRGNVPDAVIFFHGGNDVGNAFAIGRAGASPNEALSAEAYRLGRRRFQEELIELPRHSRLIRALRSALGRDGSRTNQPATLELCDDIGAYYRQQVRMAQAIGRAFDIDMLFFFQPLLATSRKPLTKWEASHQAFDGYRAMQRRCAAVVDSLMALESTVPYEPLHDMFDRDTVDAFLDGFGHLTVYGNDRVSERLADAIIPRLRARPQPRN